MKIERNLKWLAIALFAFGSFAANAQGIAWDDLSLAQQRLLADEEANWAQFEPERQQRIASRWIEMNRREQRQAAERFEAWRSLSDRERTVIRDRYLIFRQLPRAQRDRLVRARRNFDRLPLDRQRELENRFRDLSIDRRNRVLDRLRDRAVRPTDRR